MCTVCAQTPVRATSAPRGDRRGLAYLGTLRRGLAHSAKALSDEALRREWEMVDRTKQVGMRPYMRELRQLFQREEEEVLRKLQSVELPTSTRARIKLVKDPLLVSQILDLPKWEEETEDVVEKHVREIIAEGFRTGFLRIGVEAVDFTSSAPEVLTTIQQVTEKQKGVQQTLADALARDVQRGLVEGEDIDDIAKRVSARFEDMQTWKARQIAQTSATPGFEKGQELAYADAGVDRKSWLSQRDSRVREEHTAADGQTVDVDQPFEVGGETLRYPGDPAGSASNVIGCRCSTRPILSEDE